MADDRPGWLRYRRVGLGLVFLAAAAAALAFGALGRRQAPYLVSGREADATVTRMRSDDIDTLMTRLGRPAVIWRTEYRFAEADGTPRTGVDDVHVPTELRPGHTVRVAYTPGPDGRSRIRRPEDRTIAGAFAASAGLALASGLALLAPLARRRAPSNIGPPVAAGPDTP